MSILKEPFVLPYGRDFAPRKQHDSKYGHAAVDEIPLAEILENGLRREVSIYTTHTTVDYETILNDKFSLRNPLFDIYIECQLHPLPDKPSLHALELHDFYKIPEKLWHMFRYSLFTGNAPEGSSAMWEAHYSSNELRILRLDCELILTSEMFEQLTSAFNKYKNNTIPFHLYHNWDYKTTKQIEENGVQYIEEDETIPTENVWKDFIIVRKDLEPSSMRIGIASDLHYSEFNDDIKEEYPNCVDINKKIELLAKKVFKLWKAGKLDYLILNGDVIDYLSQTYNVNPFQSPPTYNESNWDGFKNKVKLFGGGNSGCLVSLFPWVKENGLLFNVPVIWNAGDHDRLMSPYPLASKQGQAQSHYNFWQLNDGEGVNFSTSYHTGERSSHVLALRWLYEQGRMEDWPLRILFRVGGKNYRIHLLDTKHMTGEFDNSSFPLKPLNSSGIDPDSISALNEGDSDDDFSIIITHSPPVCLSPDDSRLDSDISIFDSDEGDYGTFNYGREDLLDYFSTKSESNSPVLVISGHVHFRSYYSFNNNSLKTGSNIGDYINQLNAIGNTLISPSIIQQTIRNFWNKVSCLLITTPSIGPKPNKEGQSSELLLIELSPHGVSNILWKGLEE